MAQIPYAIEARDSARDGAPATGLTIRITNLGPSNAVVSGLFFGGAAKDGGQD
jgi:hypothetical protein